MAKSQNRTTNHTTTQTRSRPGLAGFEARERLLADLPVTERRVRLNGISTAVLEGGDGPPVVLLHGPGEHATKWLRVIPGLVTRHRVIAPDLPGHGATEATDALDTDRVLGWLDDLVARTCPTRPALVGQIVGGAVAARFAIDRGERLSHLVLVDALGLADFQPTPEFGQALTGYITEPTEETHDGLWRLCAFDLDRLRDGLGNRWEWIKAYNLDRARAPDLRAAQQSVMALFGLPAIPPAQLAQIAVPTTLIWGRYDLATPLPIAEAVSARHGWPLHVIENAGDDPPFEQPGAFLVVLRGALETRWNRA